MVDIQITHAYFGGGAHDMAGFGAEADDPWAGVFEVDAGVARVDHGEGDAVPAAELDEVFDGGDGDAEHLGVAGEEEDAACWGEGDLGGGVRKRTGCVCGRGLPRRWLGCYPMRDIGRGDTL